MSRLIIITFYVCSIFFSSRSFDLDALTREYDDKIFRPFVNIQGDVYRILAKLDNATQIDSQNKTILIGDETDIMRLKHDLERNVMALSALEVSASQVKEKADTVFKELTGQYQLSKQQIEEEKLKISKNKAQISSIKEEMASVQSRIDSTNREIERLQQQIDKDDSKQRDLAWGCLFLLACPFLIGERSKVLDELKYLHQLKWGDQSHLSGLQDQDNDFKSRTQEAEAQIAIETNSISELTEKMTNDTGKKLYSAEQMELELSSEQRKIDELLQKVQEADDSIGFDLIVALTAIGDLVQTMAPKVREHWRVQHEKNNIETYLKEIGNLIDSLKEKIRIAKEG